MHMWLVIVRSVRLMFYSFLSTDHAIASLLEKKDHLLLLERLFYGLNVSDIDTSDSIPQKKKQARLLVIIFLCG